LDLDVDRDPETMAAAQVSIGTLGVISTVTLQAVPAYNLKESLWREDFESCMDRHDELAANNRHFSFFWCRVAESRHLYCLPDVAAVSPVKREHDVCEMKVMNLTDEPPHSNEKIFERVASGNSERGRIGASFILIVRKTCRRFIPAFMISRRSAAKWTRRAAF